MARAPYGPRSISSKATAPFCVVAAVVEDAALETPGEPAAAGGEQCDARENCESRREPGRSAHEPRGLV